MCIKIFSKVLGNKFILIWYLKENVIFSFEEKKESSCY